MLDNKAMREVMVRFMLGVCLLAGCTSKNPALCDSDADCTNPARPFCDVKGEYTESDYTAHSCSVIPANCPVERCGCTAGAVLSCSADTAMVCGDDGHSTSTMTCPLGCASGEARCATFEPSNGLGDALADAASQPDILFPPMVHIDTGLGVVQDSGGNAVIVKTTLVPQNGGNSMIRVFEGKSFVIDSAVITGPYAVAFVAPGAITIRGLVDASANGVQPGPGAQPAPNVCAGVDVQASCGSFNCSTDGAGGGGNATVGGRGGFGGGAGGQVSAGLDPFVGGCPGGNIIANGSLQQHGGAGGGAAQFVSLTEVALTTQGFVDVSGGGGANAAGGGSAGNVIIEAPTVRIEGVTTGIAANGGAGGACGMSGPDGGPVGYAAMGPYCTPNSGGNGGTGSNPATNGENCPNGQACVTGYEGGGGGAAGRLQISTRDGNFVGVSNPVISAVVTTLVLTAH
jgi:hypothetical protein